MAAAQRPIVIARRQPLVGGGLRRRRALCASASRCRLRPPFAACICSTPLHPCYAGDLGIGPNPKLARRAIKAADLVLLVGGRLGEMPSQGYTLFDIPGPQMKLVHVHPGAEELGRVYQPHLADPRDADGVRRSARWPAAAERIAGAVGRRAAHADYLAWTRASRPSSRARSTSAQIMVWLRENLPADAIISNGAGNFAAWIHRFYPLPPFRPRILRRLRARWATACRRRWR